MHRYHTYVPIYLYIKSMCIHLEQLHDLNFAEHADLIFIFYLSTDMAKFSLRVVDSPLYMHYISIYNYINIHYRMYIII